MMHRSSNTLPSHIPLQAALRDNSHVDEEIFVPMGTGKRSRSPCYIIKVIYQAIFIPLFNIFILLSFIHAKSSFSF